MTTVGQRPALHIWFWVAKMSNTLRAEYEILNWSKDFGSQTYPKKDPCVEPSLSQEVHVELDKQVSVDSQPYQLKQTQFTWLDQ
jgi:hypothetical protein